MAIVRDGPYRVSTFSVGPYDNNVYLLQDLKGKEALLIDAANEAPRILEELDGLQVSTILTTHGHADHVQALSAVRGSTGARFACHPDDAGMMPIPPDHRVHDGEIFRFGEHGLRAVHTPGHTPGSICFLIDDLLFSGDTLFPGGPGNTSGPSASFPVIIESIRRSLFTLPDETRVLPGHGKATSIGVERPHLDEWIARGW
jgi:glyoxylase-like metal-dependent hydrolase (beta-lactamase superfamily II)